MLVFIKRILLNIPHSIQNVYHVTVKKLNMFFSATAKSERKNEDNHFLDVIIWKVYHKNQTTSLRDMSINLNVLHHKSWRYLRRHKLKPFKPKFLHMLRCISCHLQVFTFVSKIMYGFNEYCICIGIKKITLMPDSNYLYCCHNYKQIKNLY